MIKHRFAGVAVAIAVSAMAAGPAQAMDGQAFNLIFYSDATHSDTVGFAKAECTPEPSARLQWGTSSDFEEVVYVGECIDGVLYYY